VTYSLVANWQLNEGSGSIASDSSVNNNTGFLQSRLQADLIHPNATGAIEMSNRWYAALVPIL
jgi:lysophospholipase L1-like esterase